MKLFDILKYHIAHIKKFHPRRPAPKQHPIDSQTTTLASGDAIHKYYKEQYAATPAEPFMRHYFNKYIFKKARNQEQMDYCEDMLKKMCVVTQQMFEREHPEFIDF